MFPFRDILVLVARATPMAFQNPLFWALAVLVYIQYSRASEAERRLYGTIRHNPLLSTGVSMLFGFGIGFAGSLILLTLGPIINDVGILYIWPVAILLMLINPRYLCFAYAGGIVSLSSLVFGWPNVGVPQLLAIVAILHLVESILIWIDGYYGAIPGFFRMKDGAHTGGFMLQRFWLLPLMIIWALEIEGGLPSDGAIQMPEWWPVIRSGAERYVGSGFALTVYPIPVVLGYGDFSISRMPHKKVQLSSGTAMAYSLVLLSLAIAADRFGPIAIVAALFAPIGHELVIRFGQRIEKKAFGMFSMPEKGVRVLDVAEDSQSFKRGIRAGDIILSVNGIQVNDVTSIRRASLMYQGSLDLDLISGDSEGCRGEADRRRIRLKADEGGGKGLGVLLLPGPNEARYMPVEAIEGRMGKLGRLLDRLFGTKE